MRFGVVDVLGLADCYDAADPIGWRVVFTRVS
jgi:hypothetical protein